MGNHKPTPKRHIGPAIQWAKPKTNSGLSAGRRTREIRIQLADVADDSRLTDDADPHRDASDGNEAGVNQYSHHEERLRARGDSTQPAEGSTVDPWWRRGAKYASETGSAWSEYASSLRHQAEGKFSGPVQRADDSFTTYNYGQEGSNASSFDTYQSSSDQHHLSSSERAQSSSPHGDRPVWPQYLLPVAVVAFIIFLAFVTLLT